MAEQVSIGELIVRIRADANQLHQGLAQASRSIEGTATKSTRNLNRLEGAFRSLAVAGLGITGPLGAVSRALLALTGGGLIATGVLAGIGAIILHFQRLKRAAEEAKKAQDAFTESLVRAGGASIGQQRAAAQGRLDILQGRLQEELGRGRISMRGAVTPFFTPAQSKRIRELQAEIQKVQQELLLLARQAQVANREFQLMAESATRALSAARGVGVSPELAAIPGARDAGIHPLMEDIIKRQQPLMERLQASIGQRADIGRVLASDENLQRIAAAFDAQRQAFIAIGQSIGFALADGLYSVLSGGNFFKGLFRSLLGIGIGALTSGIGGAITGALTRSVGGVGTGIGGGGGSSLGSLARNADWQRLIRETQLVAASQGFRG